MPGFLSIPPPAPADFPWGPAEFGAIQPKTGVDNRNYDAAFGGQFNYIQLNAPSEPMPGRT